MNHSLTLPADNSCYATSNN